MAQGYMGKMLMVDLSKNKITEEALDENLCRQYIGGYGIGARILFSRQKAGINPLGPDNHLGFLTGPFTGSPMLSGTRYTVVGKSPLTGGWGDANSGGYFGPQMKSAGYDAVFFKGISKKPVYLFINNGKAELRDASAIWGKDSFETEDALRSELGNDVEVACIGQSGEKVCLIAAVMNNKGRAAGRSGLGAVMGSKKLKAIAVKGDMKIPIADENKANELRKKYLGELIQPLVDMFRNFGTPALTAVSALSGDSPVKNWGGVGVVDFPNAAPLAGTEVIALQTKKYACFRCPFGCGGHMKEGTGEYQYPAGGHKPEYETLCMFGSNCLNNNLESIIKANDICNRYGLDTISAGAAIAFTIECYENGLITKKDTGGIEMTWGNHKSIVAMTEKMAKREGFGNIIADGVKVAAKKIGKGSEKYAMHVGGQELPAHDPKLGFHFATTYKLDPTPARHTQGSEGFVPPGLVPQFNPKAFSGRGQAHKISSDFGHVMNSSGMCMFMYAALPTPEALPQFMSAITGWDVTLKELLKTGERISNLRQAFNIREGLNSMRVKVPDRVIGKPPQKEGPLAGVTIDEAALDNEYLAAMSWELLTTKPTKEKLNELGLDDVAKELWPYVFQV